MTVIRRLQRSTTGKVLNPGRKTKRVLLNRSRFNSSYLRREQYLVEKNTNEKITANYILDSELRKKTRILKKNNIVFSDKGKFLIVQVNKTNPSLVVRQEK